MSTAVQSTGMIKKFVKFQKVTDLCKIGHKSAFEKIVQYATKKSADGKYFKVLVHPKDEQMPKAWINLNVSDIDLYMNKATLQSMISRGKCVVEFGYSERTGEDFWLIYGGL